MGKVKSTKSRFSYYRPLIFSFSIKLLQNLQNLDLEVIGYPRLGGTPSFAQTVKVSLSKTNITDHFSKTHCLFWNVIDIQVVGVNHLKLIPGKY